MGTSNVITRSESVWTTLQWKIIETLLKSSVNFPAFLALTISKSPPNFGKSSPKLRKFLDFLGPKSLLLNFGLATFKFFFENFWESSGAVKNDSRFLDKSLGGWSFLTNTKNFGIKTKTLPYIPPDSNSLTDKSTKVSNFSTV